MPNSRNAGKVAFCNTCGRQQVHPMTLNSVGIDRKQCYKSETGEDPRCKPKRKRPFTVVGIYLDTEQRYAETVLAYNAAQAESQVYDECADTLVIAGVLKGRCTVIS